LDTWRLNINKLFSIFASLAFAVFLISSSGASDRAIQIKERRLALVIGNSKYKTSPLKNPVNDARDMANALKKLGFVVSLETDAAQKTMERSIREFGRQLKSGGVGLFYFSGHGLQVYGRNYLLPVDAKIESPSDVKFEGVDAGRVLGKMEDAGNNLNIIILDACRDNPFARSFRSSEQGLAKMDAPTGSILAYATAPGSVAADGLGRNGLYTSKLLKYMMTPGLAIERVFKNVRIDVINESGKRQVPWESSSLTGEFYFAGTHSAGPAAPLTSSHPLKTKTFESKPVKQKRIRVKIKQGYWEEGIIGKNWVPPVYEYKWIPVDE